MATTPCKAALAPSLWGCVPATVMATWNCAMLRPWAALLVWVPERSLPSCCVPSYCWVSVFVMCQLPPQFSVKRLQHYGYSHLSFPLPCSCQPVPSWSQATCESPILGMCLYSTVNMLIYSIAGCHHDMVVLSPQKNTYCTLLNYILLPYYISVTKCYTFIALHLVLKFELV